MGGQEVGVGADARASCSGAIDHIIADGRAEESTMRPTKRGWVIALAGGVCAAATAYAPDATAQMPAGSEPLPEAIPIFPLPDLTLFPNTTQPFHIFEPRYRAMIADALAGDSIIGMVMLQPGYEQEYEGRPPIYDLGCAGRIVASEQLPDGRYNIALQGVARFRVVEEDQSRPYRLASVEELPESAVEDSGALASRRRQVEGAVRSAFPRAPLPSSGTPDERAIDDLSIMLPLEPAERLELLAAAGPLERAGVLVRLLRRGAPL
jgi:Lon protease-like protein